MSTAVVLVSLAVMGVVIFGGWFVWYKNNAKFDNATTTSKTATSHKQSGSTQHQLTQENATEKWVTYKNEDVHLTFSYPESWKHEPGETTLHEGNSDYTSAYGVVISPTGKKLEWTYRIIGGKGGDCDPEPDDTPFASQGNRCSSKQTYNSEVLTSSGPDTALFNSRNTFVITETKAAHPNQPVTYQVCLDRVYADSLKWTEPGTRMGLLFPCEFWSTGFNAIFQLENEADFKSLEVKTVKEIMRTFNSY
jgi:hypothetical protein